MTKTSAELVKRNGLERFLDRIIVKDTNNLPSIVVKCLSWSTYLPAFDHFLDVLYVKCANCTFSGTRSQSIVKKGNLWRDRGSVGESKVIPLPPHHLVLCMRHEFARCRSVCPLVTWTRKFVHMIPTNLLWNMGVKEHKKPCLFQRDRSLNPLPDGTRRTLEHTHPWHPWNDS